MNSKRKLMITHRVMTYNLLANAAYDYNACDTEHKKPRT